MEKQQNLLISSLLYVNEYLILEESAFITNFFECVYDLITELRFWPSNNDGNMIGLVNVEVKFALLLKVLQFFDPLKTLVQAPTIAHLANQDEALSVLEELYLQIFLLKFGNFHEVV